MSAESFLENEANLFLVSLLALVLALIVLIYAYDLNEKPEAFTEAFLGKNPEKVKAGEIFNAEFFLKNNENQAMQYDYNISFEGKKFSKTLSLRAGEQEKFSEKISLNKTGRQKVLIEIRKESFKPEDQSLSLWFWVDVE